MVSCRVVVFIRPVSTRIEREEQMSLKLVFNQLSAYNRWANARLYQAALQLPDEAYNRDVGVFFGSLAGTLNHILIVDRLWLWRLTGQGPIPTQLDQPAADQLRTIAVLRSKEDQRLIDTIRSYEEESFPKTQKYQTTSGSPQEQPLMDILLHIFNHQTHHRGQAHSCLSILTGQEPPSLDLLLCQRGAPAPILENLVVT